MTEPEFNPESMSSDERMAYCQNVRSLVVAKQEVSEEMLQNGIKCLRAERKAASSRPTKSKSSAPMKSYTLDDL